MAVTNDEFNSNVRSIKFYGRVLPEVRKVSLPSPMKVAVNDPTGIKGTFSVTVLDGSIEVECEVSNRVDNWISLCIVKALEIVNVPVNLYAFSKGWSLSVILDESLVEGNSQSIVLSHLNVQTSEKEAWRVMREKLQIDETYLKFVTGSSKKLRHGDRGATDSKIQMEVTHRAWAIMNRYLEYVKRGETESLPVESFPILSGSCA